MSITSVAVVALVITLIALLVLRRRIWRAFIRSTDKAIADEIESLRARGVEVDRG